MNPARHNDQFLPGRRERQSPDNRTSVLNLPNLLESIRHGLHQHQITYSVTTGPNDPARPTNHSSPPINNYFPPTYNSTHHSSKSSAPQAAHRVFDTPPIHLRYNQQPAYIMSQPVTPYQPCTISPATEIIVSGERCLHPALSARKWLRTGHYIYDTRGVPLTVVDWYENVPVVLAYVRDADLASIPRFDHHFNIGDWKHVYRPQIRQVDYWANQFPGTTLHLWHGHRHQRETHGRIAIENRPPQTLTVAEQAALQYIQHVDQLEQEQFRGGRPYNQTGQVPSRYPPDPILSPGVPTFGPTPPGFQPFIYPGAPLPPPPPHEPSTVGSGPRIFGRLETAGQVYGPGAYHPGGSSGRPPRDPGAYLSRNLSTSMGGRPMISDRPYNQRFTVSPPGSRNTKTRFIVNPRDKAAESLGHVHGESRPPSRSGSRSRPPTDDPILRTIIEQSESKARFDATQSAGPLRPRRNTGPLVAPDDQPRLVGLMNNLGLDQVSEGEEWSSNDLD